MNHSWSIITSQMGLVMSVTVLSGCVSVSSRWDNTRRLNTIGAYESFIREYPDAKQSLEGKRRIAELREKEAWERCGDRSPAALRQYVQEWPQGAHIAEAKEAIEDVEWKGASLADTLSAYESYLERHPSARNAAMARAALAKRLDAEWQHVVEQNDLERGRQLAKKGKPSVGILTKSAASGNNELLQVLLDAGANPNETNSDGETPLITALSSKQAHAAKTLVAAGADLKMADKSGMTPLIEAANAGQAEICQKALAVGADVNASYKNGNTALILAAARGHLEIVRMLLDAKAEIDKSSKGGYTALIVASSFGHTEVVKALLERGADPDSDVVQGKDAIELAEENKHTEVAVLLRKYSLHQLCRTGDLDGIKALLDTGVSIDRKNPDGQTPLHLAAQKGHLAILEYLLAKGADPVARDRKGKTPMQYALDAAQGGTIKRLLRKGVKVGSLEVGNNDRFIGLSQGDELRRVTDFTASRTYISNGKSISARYAIASKDPLNLDQTPVVPDGKVSIETGIISGGFAILNGRTVVDDGSQISIDAKYPEPEVRVCELAAKNNAKLDVRGFLLAEGEQSEVIVAALDGLLLGADGNVLHGWLLSSDTVFGQTDMVKFLQTHVVRADSLRAAGVGKETECAVFRIAEDGTLVFVP